MDATDWAERAERWRALDPDPKTRSAIAELIAQKNQAALKELFDGRLAFGTAGLRAHLGPGPKRINRLLIRQSTQGLALALKAEGIDLEHRAVVVGYDGRKQSQELAFDTAGVLAAQGLRVELVPRPTPTPVVGFWCKHTHAAAAIVITASHNPPAYNGYKVFWHTATQICPPTDALIAAHIDAVAKSGVAPICLSLDDARARGLLKVLNRELYKGYLDAISKLSVHSKGRGRSQLKIAYTPLHGVGAEMAEQALAGAGFTNVESVQVQRAPDASFATVASPNPEEPESLVELVRLAEASAAEIACANDPDADRLATLVRHQGKLRRLSGDELGLILAHDRLAHLPKGGHVASTLVSSPLIAQVAAHHGAHFVLTLTGFKWLAQVALGCHRENKPFAFAYEEALGYAVGNVVWDKDGISALVAICELASELFEQGKTLMAVLDDIGAKVGFCCSTQRVIDLGQRDGKALMKELMPRLPSRLGPYERQQAVNLRDRGAFGDLPPTDGHLSVFEDTQGVSPRIIVRPSGTEPKLKCYYDVTAPPQSFDDWLSAQAALGDVLERLAAEHLAHVQRALEA